MKNILLVFTGGTIGSMASEGTINTTKTESYKLLELFKQQDSSHLPVHFTTIQPLQILSENLAPKAWQLLIHAIEAEHPEHFLAGLTLDIEVLQTLHRDDLHPIPYDSRAHAVRYHADVVHDSSL